MCLASVFIEIDGQRDQVMQDVAWIESTDGELKLVSFLGESKTLQARVESIDLMNSAIILKRITADVTQKGTP